MFQQHAAAMSAVQLLQKSAQLRATSWQCKYNVVAGARTPRRACWRSQVPLVQHAELLALVVLHALAESVVFIAKPKGCTRLNAMVSTAST